MIPQHDFKSLEMLASHPRLRRVAKALIVLFSLFFIGIAFLPWQQTATGYGKVVAFSPNEREQRISAPVDGRLGKWFVHDGSFVNKGDPIVKLEDNDPNLLQRLEMEKKAIESSIELNEKAAETALINVERQKKLFEEGISSRREFEKANFTYLKYKNDVAKANVELTKINVRIARVESQMVRAPLAGTILRRMPGEQSVLVKQGDVLAVLVPKTKSRAVELYLEGLDIPLISVGQQVRLQFQGWPAIQFSGWPSVAVGTFAGRVALIDPTDTAKGKFRILVLPEKGESWPGPQYLRQGVRAHGWVLLSRVSLWFELWRIFNGFPPSVDPAKLQLQQQDDY